MLPKSNRLPSSDIRLVLKDSKRIMRGPIIVAYKKNGGTVSRFSFVVSTGVDKRATARNRMKRLLRESVQHIVPELTACIDAVIMVRSKFNATKQEEAENMLRSIFAQEKLL